MNSDFRKVGDDYIFTWKASGIGVRLSKMRAERNDIRCEIEIADGHKTLHWGALLLKSVSGRSGLAKDMMKIREDFDWVMALNYVCHQASIEFTRPTPLVNLAHVETTEAFSWLIEGFLPKDEITYMYADGGSSKSLTAMWLALAVARGSTLPHGLRATEAQEVLYLDWETNAVTASRRLRKLAKGMGMSFPPTVHYRACRHALPDEMEQIRRDVDEHKAGLVIVDSIGMAVAGDLNAAETANQANSLLRSLPCTKLVIAHVSHQSAESKTNGTGAPFGSRFFHNGARCTWSIRKVDDEDDPDILRLGLFQTKFNEGVRMKAGLGLTITFKEDAIIYERSEIEDDADLRAGMSLPAQIRAVLRKGSKTTKEIATELDARQDSVGKTLRRMPSIVRLNEGKQGTEAEWGLAE